MARVNVEQKAFIDDRFVRLGVALGIDRWGALGRMALVWNTCQERENHTLSRETINAIHVDIPNLADLLVACELARETKHGIYIAGAKERCGWLGKARKNGKLGGRPKKNHTVSHKEPSGSAGKNPPAPAPAPAPTKRNRPKPLPIDFEPDDSCRQIATERGLSIANEVALMRDWALSNDVTKADWIATFRNWLRRSKNIKTLPPARKHPTVPSEAAQLFADLQAKATK